MRPHLSGAIVAVATGSEDFRKVMVTYFAQKGFSSTDLSRERRILEMVAL